MTRNNRLKVQSFQYFIQGMLLGVLPVSILAIHADNPLLPGWQLTVIAALSTFLMLSGSALLFRKFRSARFLLISGVLLNSFIMLFEYMLDPLLTMFSLLAVIALIYYLCTARLFPATPTTAALQLDRFLGNAVAVFALTLFSPLFASDIELFALAVFLSLILLIYLAGNYVLMIRRLKYKFFWRMLILTLFAGTILLFSEDWIVLSGFIAGIAGMTAALCIKHADLKFLELILQHPARCLVLTFFVLCAAGTLLLRTPAAMQSELSVLEAAFTAVSGACVTGLTVIDIASDLTLTGRIFLLLIIQLGGLGIMTLTIMALHALGRVSLTGEQLISELAAPQDQNIYQHLKLIVLFTFITEFSGAMLLTWGFYNIHHDFARALELGFFTSISAFCNAGFFPGSANLMPYAGEKFLLLIIAFEIIIGGIAPAITYSLLKKQSIRKLPVIAKIILGSSAILLVGGTLLLLLFEWNGIFNELAWYDKIVNAFFQSTTLRTAGFNTVSLAALGMPAYMLMLALMFIGGSPGGTAGGIKTTTLAVLALTFRAALRGENQVIGCGRRIAPESVIKAVAILISATLVLLLTLITLTATQILPARQLVFEAFSALATVGLSLNCTANLDAVGQIIIMLAMFAGRIGPLTLFLLLSERNNSKAPGYPQIKIPLA